MAVRCIDDDQIAFRIYQSFCPLQSLVTHRRRCSHAQAAGGILRGLRISYCLFNILDRDEADAMIMPIDNQQLFDAPLMQQAACILLTDPRLHGDRKSVVYGKSVSVRVDLGGRSQFKKKKEKKK